MHGYAISSPREPSGSDELHVNDSGFTIIHDVYNDKAVDLIMVQELKTFQIAINKTITILQFTYL